MAGREIAGATGRVLQGVIGAIRLVRHPRPVHPIGVLLQGRLAWLPRGRVRSGIAWIDDRGDGGPPDVTARLSRAVGLPAALPDVLGLALRVPTAAGSADLLLATTGLGLPGRFVLTPHRTPTRVVFTTLMPYRGSDGPVLVAARSRSPRALPARMRRLHDALAVDPWRLDLLFATPAGRWHRFAELALTAAGEPLDSATVRFDPVLAPPPGAGTYAWTRLIREPAYTTARRG